jgi:hypothetical protein
MFRVIVTDSIDFIPNKIYRLLFTVDTDVFCMEMAKEEKQCSLYRGKSLSKP